MDVNQEFAALPEDVRTVLGRPEVIEALSGYVQKAVQPLVSKRDELLGQLSETKEVIKGFGGVDAIKALKAQADLAARASEEAAAKSNDIETVKKTYAEKMAEVVKERDALRQSRIDDKANGALARAIRDEKGVPELLEPHLKSRVRAEMVDGEVKLTVLGANGAPMLNADGKDASIRDLVAEFKASSTFARAFEATNASGSGAKGAPTLGAGQSNPWNPATRNITEQMKLSRENPQAAKAMAAQHGVTLAL